MWASTIPHLKLRDKENVFAKGRHTRSSDLTVSQFRSQLSCILHAVVILKLKSVVSAPNWPSNEGKT